MHGWWLLLVLALALYLPGTATIPLMDRDEPRFAHATVEMMQRGSWTIPYFNGEYRFDKPPLTYWWMRLHYALLGVNELAARLHSVVAVFLTALAVAGMARRLGGGSRAGLFAGVAWLTSLQSLVHGRLCVADMPMILCVVLSSRALFELLAAEAEGRPMRRRGWWFWCLWLSLGAGFLAKGPIAWLVPAVSLLLWRWVFWRRPLPWQRLQAGQGALVALVLVAAWGVPALIETNGAFWRTGMGEHVVRRGTAVFNGRRFIPGYYLLTTWLSLFPWLGFAVPVWCWLRSRWTVQTTFFAAWFVAPQIIFFFYATQLPHYVMPGYAGFIVLLALAWQERHAGRSAGLPIPPVVRWLTAGFAVLLGVVWCSTQMMEIPLPAIRGLLNSILLTLACVLVFGGLAACIAWKRGMKGGSTWFAAVVVVLTAVCLSQLGGALRAASVPLHVAERLGTLPQETRLHGCGYTEPSLVFYTDREWQFTDDVAKAPLCLAASGPVAVVVLNREWTLDKWFKGVIGTAPAGVPAKDQSAAMDSLLRRSPDVQHHLIAGFNMARFSWVEVVLLVRK